MNGKASSLLYAGAPHRGVLQFSDQLRSLEAWLCVSLYWAYLDCFQCSGNWPAAGELEHCEQAIANQMPR